MKRTPTFLIVISMLAIATIEGLVVWHHVDLATSARKVAAMERQLAAEVRNLNKNILLFQERAEVLADEGRGDAAEILRAESESDVIRSALRKLGAVPAESESVQAASY